MKIKILLLFFLVFPMQLMAQLGVGAFLGSQNLHATRDFKQQSFTFGAELRTQGPRWFAHLYFRQTIPGSKTYDAKYDDGSNGAMLNTSATIRLSAYYLGVGAGVTFSRTSSRTRPYLFLDIGQGRINLNATNTANASSVIIKNKKIRNGLQDISDFQMRFSAGFQFLVKKSNCLFYEASIFAGTSHPFVDWSYAIDIGYRYYFK